MSRPVAVRKALPLAGLAMGALRGLATAGKAAVKNPLKTLGAMNVADKVKPKSMAQTGMEMQQKRAEMQQQKNQAQMSSAQEMADKAKAGADVVKGEYVHTSVQQPMNLAWQMLFKESVELHHNEELPQEFIDDIMMLDRTHKMTPTNNGTLIEDIDPFMHRTIQLMAENYKEDNPMPVQQRSQHLFH